MPRARLALNVETAELVETIKKLDEVCSKIDVVSEKATTLGFITIAKMAELTGWSKKTVEELYNRRDFPSCDFGKSKVAEVNAVKEYFSVPRRK